MSEDSFYQIRADYYFLEVASLAPLPITLFPNANSRASSNFGAMSCKPIGSPSSGWVPTGKAMAGIPAMLACTVKMSARNMATGSSSFSPKGQAVPCRFLEGDIFPQIYTCFICLLANNDLHLQITPCQGVWFLPFHVSVPDKRYRFPESVVRCETGSHLNMALPGFSMPKA
jgi:hypothetical protein